MKYPVPLAGLVIAAAISAPAAATEIALTPDASWHEFVIDSLVAPSFGTGWIDFTNGSPLTFTFTIGAGNFARLSVVDAGFSGDTFSITNNGAAFGTTSAVAPGTIDGNLVGDFDAAFADTAYSRGVFTLGAGSYRISGRLAQSVTDGGAPINATNGAVRLALVAAVPEPSTYALLLAGLSAVGFATRRRSR